MKSRKEILLFNETELEHREAARLLGEMFVIWSPSEKRKLRLSERLCIPVFDDKGVWWGEKPDLSKPSFRQIAFVLRPVIRVENGELVDIIGWAYRAEAEARGNGRPDG